MALQLSGSADVAARSLLGAVLRHEDVAVRIVEVEAYGGATDPASHAARGRTPRNEVMFGPAGHLYCYFSYGMHWACNVVCGPDGTASGVLLRGGEIVEGIDVARSRRGRSTDRDLARGPGRLGQALAIDATVKGTYLLDGGPLTVTAPTRRPRRIVSGPRVGVALEADRPWRFWIEGDPHVSVYRRSPRAPAPG